MDISNLTSLINALRAETQEDSITPESLGALLQRIVDVLGDAASDFTVQQLEQWQHIIQMYTSVITSLQQGGDDRNNLLLNVDVVNPSTGVSLARVISLKQATTERAGIMRAQQVTDLNWCRNRIQEIINQLVGIVRSSVMDVGSASLAVQQKNTGATASGERAFAINDGTQATGKASSAEGDYTLASGFAAHAEGSHTEASGSKAHAEGMESVASGENTHTEGRKTRASNSQAHAQGEETEASGVNSHAGGYQSKATGKRAFAHGYQCQAQSENGVALNCATITSNDSETAVGRFNKSTLGKTLFAVGGGSSTTNRRNIFEVQKDGNILINLNNVDDVSLQQFLTNAASAAQRAEQTALEGWQRMLDIEHNVRDIQTQVNTFEGGEGSTAYFIQLEAVEGLLFVRGSVNDFLTAGLVPYIFRYSVKQHRVRPRKGYERRKGPRRIGWHLFYGEGKIKVYQGGRVAIRSDHEDSTKGKYLDNPDFLFSEPLFIESDGDGLSSTNLAYGKRTYNVRYSARKFRFGIAFGLPIPEESNFYFHLLRTNIAEIKVRAFYNSDTEDVEFNWSR